MTDSLIPSAVLQAISQIARTTPPGMFVEVGVYRGGSAILLYDAAIQSNPPRAVHLFDTFTGIPFAGPEDRHQPGEFNATNAYRSILQKAMPSAHFHVGIFPETLTDDIRDIAFSHIDCDQYQSVRDCVHHLWPRMVPNGIMWFDDVGVLPGAWKAVREFFSEDELLHAPEGRRYVVKRGIG